MHFRTTLQVAAAFGVSCELSAVPNSSLFEFSCIGRQVPLAP